MGGFQPLTSRSTEVIRFLSQKQQKLPIIGVGGIHSADDAIEKLSGSQFNTIVHWFYL
jgi:dihydroorotate dehydrogenase